MWCEWLNLLGFRADGARNGLEGVQHALEQPPDVVLMDIRMPVMNGLEATQHLQADATTAGVPIIILSAEPAARRAAQDLGCHFIRKPVGLDELLTCIRGVLAARRSSGAGPSARSDPNER
jgi:CheY-like chemotaxis protein